MNNVTVMNFINIEIGLKLRLKKRDYDIKKMPIINSNRVIGTFKDIVDQNVEVLKGRNMNRDGIKLNGQQLIGQLTYNRKANVIELV